MSHKNNKFKISPSIWNKNYKISDGSYSILDIQYYVEY